MDEEEPHAKVKVCLVGADTGCKTRLVRKHVLENFGDRYIVTLGTKVSKREIRLRTAPVGAPIRVDLLIWDVMSKKGFRELLKEAYFRGARGVLAVSDMTRRDTLADLDDWIRSVETVTGPIPAAIIGANHDRKDRLQVTAEEIAHVAEEHDAACFFASENAGEGVEAAFRYLADTILKSLLE